MPTDATTQHPKEAVLHMDDALKEKLNMLEKKLTQIKDELLGVSPAGKDEAPKPELAGFLAKIQDRLHENCIKVDRMIKLANEVVKSLIGGEVISS